MVAFKIFILSISWLKIWVTEKLIDSFSILIHVSLNENLAINDGFWIQNHKSQQITDNVMLIHSQLIDFD